MDEETRKLVEEATSAFSELIKEFIRRIHDEESSDEEFKKIIDRWAEAKIALKNKNLKMRLEMLDFHFGINSEQKSPPAKNKKIMLKLNNNDNRFLRSLKITPPDKEGENTK